jgi:uncharacterized coiled-coil DUF342 family protein
LASAVNELRQEYRHEINSLREKIDVLENKCHVENEKNDEERTPSNRIVYIQMSASGIATIQ